MVTVNDCNYILLIKINILNLVPNEAPRLMLHSVNATHITVSWNRESCLSRNGPDRYYNVRYYETGSTQVLETTNVNISNTIFTTAKLNPVSSYTFNVTYINTIGSGPSVSLMASTLGFSSK